MINSQSQKGGDSSTNIQTQQMIVHIGIDEKRAREIYQEMNLQAIKDFSKEAFNVANTRVVEFENSLMLKMAQVEGALEAFADPSFQLLLVEAQKTAASTERPADYDLLSELLIHRFQKGNNRIARTGISRAVEIVDNISDEALLGLTVTHAISSFTPISGDIHQGLDILNGLFGKLLYRDFPEGSDWLDHLDILDAVRLNPLGGLKKVQQYYLEKLHGYVDVGIQKNSENHSKVIEILTSNNLPTDILVEHVLNCDFIRLNISNVSHVDYITWVQPIIQDGKLISLLKRNPTKDQKKAIESIYTLYSKDNDVKQNNINTFIQEWDNRSNLKALREWWDNIPVGFTVTAVGKVLAHSNAQRCDNTLPPLD